MPIIFNRSICCDLQQTISREWLITNGAGSYAAGTVSNILTRMEHGLLVACPPENNTPHLFLAKIDEEIDFDQRTYYLGNNEYRDGILSPSGFVHLETFQLEDGFPVFTYRLGGIGGIMLEKRIWMEQGHDTTYIQYRVLPTTRDETVYQRDGYTGPGSQGANSSKEPGESTLQPITLTLLPLTAYRPHTHAQYGSNDWHFDVQSHGSKLRGDDFSPDILTLQAGIVGCTIRAWEGAHPYHLLALGQEDSETTFISTNVWYWNFLRRQDAAQGKPAHDDLYLPGVVRAKLWPREGSTLTISVSTEKISDQHLRPDQVARSYKRSVEEQRQMASNSTMQRYFGEGGEAARAQRLSVLSLNTKSPYPTAEDEAFLGTLIQACQRFMIQRPSQHVNMHGDYDLLLGRGETMPDVLSNFYMLNRLTRDTLIALPGLLLATGRYRDGATLLRSILSAGKQGMLPETLPPTDNSTEKRVYKSADLLLWFCYSLDSYVALSHDTALLHELYPQLVEHITWLIRGNEYGVQCDERDGLLRLSHGGMTWMDATRDAIQNVTRDEQFVTPRAGKPIEINALWYNALSLLAEWSQQFPNASPTKVSIPFYQELAALCKISVQRKFWNAKDKYLYDVIEGPAGDDASLRPNQLLALSLRYPLVTAKQRTNILAAVSEQLLTPYGLRTLAPGTQEYHGALGNTAAEQQAALHQGCAWTWLLGPYFDALYNLEYQSDFDESTWNVHVEQLAAFKNQLTEALLDMIGGVFDGNTPHTSGYTAASLMGCTELLRAYQTVARVKVRHLHLVRAR